MKLKIYQFTLILAGLSTPLCFAAGRVTMHNSPKRSQPQLRSPSAPRQQSVLKLFAQAQTSNPQLKKSNDDVTVSSSNNLQEIFKKLDHEIWHNHTAIRQYQKNVSYSDESLTQFTQQITNLYDQLKNIDVSRASQQIREGCASLKAFLQQDLGAVDEMSKHLHQAEEALPRRIDSPKPMLIPAISDEFKMERINQVKITPPTPATPARTAPSPKRLAELMRTPQAAQQENLKQEFAVTQELGTQTDLVPNATEATTQTEPAVESQPSAKAETQFTESAVQTDLSFETAATQTEPEVPTILVNPQPNPQSAVSLLHLHHPSFMRRHWKFITICSLITGGLLIGGQTKYKLLTRFAHLFTK